MWQAYTPWPGIYTMYEGKRLLLEITNYELRITNYGTLGQVVKVEDGQIGVICSG
jgi:methionyl-tRNA formyltransferase